MQGLIVLVLGAAFALNAVALPYEQQEDGYHYKKTNPNDNAYSPTNQQNVEISGITQGRTFAGHTKSGYNTGGESHHATNSFASGSFIGNVPGHVVSGASSHVIGHPAGETGFVSAGAGSNSANAINHLQGASAGSAAVQGPTQYWWMGQGTPFALGCDSPACANNGFDIKKVGAKGTAVVSNDISGNAQGTARHGVHHHSGHAHGHAHASLNAGLNGNPFLHQGAVSVPSQVPEVPHVQHPSVPQQSLFPGTAPQVIVPSNNPFLAPGSGSSVLIPAVNHGTEQIIEQSVQHGVSGPNINSGAFTGTSHQSSEGAFTVSCSGVGKICVPKDQCVNGYANAPRHTQPQSKHCDIGGEVCCAIRQTVNVGSVHATSGHNENKGPLLPQGFTNNHAGHVNVAVSGQTSNGGLFGTNHQPQRPVTQGGLFGSTSGVDVDLNAGDGDSNVGATNVGEYSGYLPPIGSAPSSNIPAFSKPPQEDVPDDQPAPSSNQPTRVIPQQPELPPPQLGCAAALVCVEEKFCNLEGVISPDPVSLSSEQLLRRVPLTSCKNPENGVIGKCCRDPNYVDPWPTSNLPANYTGGFDEQGFPTFLNIAKTRPTKKVNKPSQQNANRIPAPVKAPLPIKTSQPVKTFQPATAAPETKTFPQFSLPPQIQSIGNQIQGIPNQIQQQIQNFLPQLNPFRPTTTTTTEVAVAELVPEVDPSPSADEIVVQIPTTTKAPGGIFGNFPQLPSFPNFPNLPQFSNPFAGGKNTYDSASSNQVLVSITPHRPGAQCGLMNQVQRPHGLSDVDAAFGEIPWQAMILSTRDRKLLCSGAIIAPNVVLTAAHCTYGLRPEDVSIKSGEWKLGYELKHEEPLPFEIVKVETIVYHPGYVAGSPGFDLAILFLEHPVGLDQHVDTICIGETPEIQPQRKCIATGWGKTVLQVNVAGALMHKIDVDVLPEEVCRERLDNAENQIGIDDTLVCTKAHRVNNNMCQVDVGGPLACDRGDGIYELTGVYSQDTGCIPTNQVATFALIDTKWVKEVMSSPPLQRVEPLEDLPSVPSTIQLVPAKTYHHVHQATEHKEPCDCQQSNLPPANNQYLPPL